MFCNGRTLGSAPGQFGVFSDDAPLLSPPLSSAYSCQLEGEPVIPSCVRNVRFRDMSAIVSMQWTTVAWNGGNLLPIIIFAAFVLLSALIPLIYP
jgi:hypothetical protein